MGEKGIEPFADKVREVYPPPSHPLAGFPAGTLPIFLTASLFSK